MSKNISYAKNSRWASTASATTEVVAKSEERALLIAEGQSSDGRTVQHYLLPEGKVREVCLKT